ncbi:PAS domain-containing hybrid sensor histidine kinase/response regulator [Martelella sp. HB161492]|uniref:PAS domain-containing hybrid sensor histidine kinase/response regulator n=1 Tax=Martelella sp. HB161492 TaxID=2720726 RepID=UPI00158FEB04|nr:PAS domain-containing hybrid sensor histidine kinase/response regulator [Martelella sp. HB161492]
MLPSWLILLVALSYILLLFVVASFGDRRAKRQLAPLSGRPFVYSLSLAVYCTSWTYFGGVGLAADRGLEFLGIYLGPIVAFTLGMPLLRRMVGLAKAEKLTSAADFLAARYGKNSTVAGLVAVISLAAAIPYIALQLKAVSDSVAAMVGTPYGTLTGSGFLPIGLPFAVTLVLASFAIIFGTRHTDATEHQDGLILAIAMESVVKLIAFGSVGFFVLFVLFKGPADLFARAAENSAAMAALSYDTPISRWILLILLSACAILLLPRQFHVTVVENRSERELNLARFLFPLYLVAINILVLPVALGGLMILGPHVDADLYVLQLPIAEGMPFISLITFIGGFSAATAMVIVSSVALAIMLSNDIVNPIFLRRRMTAIPGRKQDFSNLLLNIRRASILGVMLLGYVYYRHIDSDRGLFSIGLLAFAAIAQVAPALIIGLIWRRANARGAIIGLSLGFLVWAYLLFIPSLGGPDHSALAGDILDVFIPGTGLFTGPAADPLLNVTCLSLSLNILGLVLGSLSRPSSPLERIQSGIFVKRQARWQSSARGLGTGVSVGALKDAITGYLGDERTLRSFATFENSAGRKLDDGDQADMALIHFSEQLLASAIGSSSARLVLSLVLQRAEAATGDAAFLLDQASEALQYNQGMLQTALAHMDQGIAVFDATNRLTVWNRRFRELLSLPDEAGQVGYPLINIIGRLSSRGDLTGQEAEDILKRLRGHEKAFPMVLESGHRIIEVQSRPMPDKGMVVTFTDITRRVAADLALKQANETLELRVNERTAELTRVNEALRAARRAADEANIGKTRFFAAAGHDILQPLNAARLYAAALGERMPVESDNRVLSEKVDSALQSVEDILGAVLDISRLDAGAMKPHFTSVALDELLRRVETDFQPLAQERGLKLIVVPSHLKVRSDIHLLRRLIQNLVSNAIKYTVSGEVLVGVRRNRERATVMVIDTGIGIPETKIESIFKEFTRLEEGARTAQGLGLGLSIVDRLSRMLSHPVSIDSSVGKGTVFRVSLPLSEGEEESEHDQPITIDAAGVEAISGLKVLCIDNEEAILEGMRLLVEGWGGVVETAATGADAISSGFVPDVIIADYHLDHENGIEAVTAVREHFSRHIPAMLLTADRTREVRDAALEEDMALQHKPVKTVNLKAFLSQIARFHRVAGR